MFCVAEIPVVGGIPVRIVMAVEVAGVINHSVSGGIAVTERAVVRPDVVPWFAHGVEGWAAGTAVGPVGTAEVDAHHPVIVTAVNCDVVIGVGQDGAGTAVGTDKVDLQVFNGRMFHFDAHVEDVVVGSQHCAAWEIGESDFRAVVEAVGRTVLAVGQEHRVAHRQGGRLHKTHIFEDDVVAGVGAHVRHKGLTCT